MKKKERVKDPDKIKKRDNIFTIILSICDVVSSSSIISFIWTI